MAKWGPNWNTTQDAPPSLAHHEATAHKSRVPDDPLTYVEDKLKERGYPGYPATSQADVMVQKAEDSGMYPSTMRHPQAIVSDPVCWADKLSATSARLEIEKIPNEQAMRIVTEVLPKVLELWLMKSGDYGGTSGGLGPKAPFVDIWRKIVKLKRSLWEGEELQFEQPDEILMDLVGTTLNILDELGQAK